MAFSRGPKIVTDGLVLYLDAANPKSYPGTGNVWNDLSGNGNDAILINSPTYNNNYFSFDGVDDYGVVNSNLKNQINNSTSTTVTVLANVKLIEHVDNVIGWGNANYDNDGNRKTWGIYSRSGTLKAGYTGGDIAGTEIYNNWYFLTGIFTPTLMTGNKFNGDTSLSFNSSSVTSTDTWKNISNSYDIRIARTSYWTRHMQTDIAEIKVYNKELSNEEILQNYNATKSRFGL